MKRIITIYYKLARIERNDGAIIKGKAFFLILIAVISVGGLVYLLTSKTSSRVHQYVVQSDTVSTASTAAVAVTEPAYLEPQPASQVEQPSQNQVVNTAAQTKVCNQCGGNGNLESHSTCDNCNGIGASRCANCKGNGSITCFSCSGRGNFQCIQCNGKGINHCSTCGGKGRFYNGLTGKTETCYACNGAKGTECSYCRGTGKDSCQKCNGSGKMACFECSQTGQIACIKCLGKKVFVQTSVCNKCNGSGAVAD